MCIRLMLFRDKTMNLKQTLNENGPFFKPRFAQFIIRLLISIE